MNKNEPQIQETVGEKGMLAFAWKLQERFTDVIKSETTSSHLYLS